MRVRRPIKTIRQKRIESAIAKENNPKIIRLLNREWWREFFGLRNPEVKR